MIGETLKHYRIESMLGAGGMGEVYQAKDTKLGRTVALKVLPEAFARDGERVARFEREAKLLAALNHSNIAALYGMDDDDGRHFLVMELVDGETLADRLRRGAMPVAEALRIAFQIAEALEAAHEKGIVHRDLKPANVKITADGKVKVLDFGLAKAMEPASGGPQGATAFSNSPTISMAATNAGVILGTAAYMSPEQANGHAADARSDLFSFGSVLYEMLTGRQPFHGKTLSEVLASVLVREPDWSGLPSNLNPRIRELLRRCLEKEPKRRWQAAGDVRLELESLIADPSGVTSLPQSSAASKPLWKSAIPLVAVAVLVAAAASFITWTLRPSPPAAAVMRFPLVLPPDQTLNVFATSVAISADNTKLAYVVDNQIFLRQMAEMTARPVAGTGAAFPPIFFSPDGQWIAFFSFADSALKKISVMGGAAIPLARISIAPLGASWSDTEVVWGEFGKGILRVSENGGEPEVLVSAKSGEQLLGPQILGGGKALLYTLATAPTAAALDAAQVMVKPLPSGEPKVVLRGGADAHYLPSGHIIYALGNNILAVPFNLEKLETRGGALPVVEAILRMTSGLFQSADFSVSPGGMLLYVPASGRARGAQTTLAFVDRSGKFEKLPLPPGAYEFPRLSPDGKQIAVHTNDGKSQDVWIYELSGRGALRKLTLDGNSGFSAWSYDSQRVIFGSANALFWQRADGTGPAEALTKPEPESILLPESVDPFGKVLAFTRLGGTTGGISLLSLEGERKIQPFVEVPQTLQVNAAFSPDGRWLAYMSTELNGIPQVFVQPYPSTGAKYQITTAGGATPLWSPNGKQLFYVWNSKMFVLDVRTEPTFSALGQASELPITGTLQPTGERNYDIARDGRLLVVIPSTAKDGAPATPQQINIVLNWFEELKRLVPVK